jgi:hypothetical protein
MMPSVVNIIIVCTIGGFVVGGCCRLSFCFWSSSSWYIPSILWLVVDGVLFLVGGGWEEMPVPLQKKHDVGLSIMHGARP